jgi:tRNA pseudouridine55 synthase
MTTPLSGVLVVDKAAGPTSHDVVDLVRRALGERRAGHTGTLDPFATGVLAVCVGKATRLARFLGGDKQYRATVRLGYATTTDDFTGQPLGTQVEVHPTVEQVSAALRPFVGSISQLPPVYSAKRVEGKRAYAQARRGNAVQPRACQVTIHRLDLVRLEGPLIELDVACSSGTYVRSLARDLGQALGTGGHLAALRRTRCGDFGLEQAVPSGELGPASGEALIPLTRLLAGLPAVAVSDAGARAVRHGRDVGREAVASGFPGYPPPARVRLLDEAGSLLALAVPRGFERGSELPLVPVLHPDVVLAD